MLPRLHPIYLHHPFISLSGTSAYIITNKEEAYHVPDMKSFIFNADLVDPVDVARRDYMEFLKWLLKTLIAYRGNLKRKTELEFQVKWFGYDENHNSWEPYVIPVIQINFMFSFAKTICCS